MTETQTLVFEGRVTAVSPLAVTRPDDALHMNDKVGRLPRAGAKKLNTPVYFPGSSLSGKLRRACRDIAREATISATDNDKPFSLDVHYMLTQGVDTTNSVKNEKSDGVITRERGLRETNPLLSLFGRWKLPGHLSIGDLIPEGGNDTVLFTHGAGVRTDDFARDPGQASFLNPDDTARLKKILVDDLLSQKDVAELNEEKKNLTKLIRTAGPEDKAEYSERVAELDSEMKAIKSAKAGSEESIQRPLDGYEAIVPGTQLKHKMILANANALEIGLFLDTLLRFSEMPFVGSHFRNGCGEISATWDVKMRRPGTMSAEVVGTIALSHNEFEVVDHSPEKLIESAFEAWTKAKADLEGAQIDFTRFLMLDE